ncbi:MAG: CaiB/BaiF CoA transferase family protein [Minwuia sp.]|uniref:CaiB/BaiF CoA transferase family protein n=1 Tax=Minwuia sp. TaxID=2493630 RepID=UPI003A892E78
MTPESENRGPLKGYRIVDLTRIVLGPLAGQMLGDLGADVIKVEEPSGDLARAIGTGGTAGMASCFLNCNRNKRSVSLDLKQKDGLDALLKLIETADVFIHALRPQAVRKLGIAYEDLKAVNPNLIYVGCYGFSEKGPYGHKAAFDDIIQSASGGAAIQGWLLDQPRYVGFIQADKTTGLMAANAVTAALLHRERTGEAQFVEVPMFETMVHINLIEHLDGATFADAMGPTGYIRLRTPWRKPYPSKDGWVAILPYDDRQWRIVFEAAGRQDLAEDPMFMTFAARQANVDKVYETLSELSKNLTTDEWIAALDPKGVPCSRVNTPEDLLTDEHLADVGFWENYDHPTEGPLRSMKYPVNFEKSPASIRRHTPHQGEQTREVLHELGYDDETIDAMLAAGAAIDRKEKAI